MLCDMRNLSSLQPKERVEVVQVDADSALLRRLLSLGVRPGAEVELLRRAPLGDPLEVKIRGTLLSIRNSEAARVYVGG